MMMELLADFAGICVGSSDVQIEKIEAKKMKHTRVDSLDFKHTHDSFALRQADGLFRIRGGSACSELYVTIEYQSTCKRNMPVRLFEYQLLLMLKLNRERLLNIHDKRDMEILPAMIPIVIYNGKRRWSVAKQTSATLFAVTNQTFQTMTFPYLLVDIMRLESQMLLDKQSLICSIFYIEQVICDDSDAWIERLSDVSHIWQRFSDDEMRIALEWLFFRLYTIRPQWLGQFHFQIEEFKKKGLIRMSDKMVSSWNDIVRVVREEGLLEGKAEGKVEGERDLAKLLVTKGLIRVEEIARLIGMEPEDIVGKKDN
jgi:hypothetical protein